jgi:hypothetical protein
MGISVALVNCLGQPLETVVGDPKNLLHRLLPPTDEDSVTLLTKIDWYDDTYFNYLQMKIFLKEWDKLAKEVRTPEEPNLIEAIRLLAVRCQSERLLLGFIGD